MDKEEVLSEEYVVGHVYRDKSSPQSPKDQFMRWINLPDSGMPNSGGIRPLSYLAEPAPDNLPAIVVLVTNHVTTTARNPWDDIVDHQAGEIIYWGDAKKHEAKTLDDFNGNKSMRAVYDAVLEQRHQEVPPILHFTRIKSGYLRFNGLCVPEKIELDWFEDDGVPVRNYRFFLRVLDEDRVAVRWLHERRVKKDLKSRDAAAPSSWKTYVSGGQPTYLTAWGKKVLGTEEQLPDVDSREDKLLRRLHSLGAHEFEHVVVGLLAELDEVTHHVETTRAVSDGGFDFFGEFRLPPPLQYSIRFRGEAKKYARSTSVGAKDVSRLVARLQRGEYGLFVTTSYFSRAAQQEVYEYGYPVTLIHGAQLASMFFETGLVRQGQLASSWLQSVLSTVEPSG